VEDPTLADLLRAGPLVPRRVVTIARHIAEALAAVAAHGVVHRDLKPANIFVSADDTVKLADFGIASIVRSASASTTSGARPIVSGTPAYMSPEQALGEHADTRADIYSLGCVMFEMLSGSPPFRGPSPLAVIEHHCSSPLPALESPLGAIAEVVRRIVLRALAKRPEERFQRADEMIAELSRAADLLDRPGWRRWLPR
jgi:eukaryotic-like serine/threonine-protein kinase